MCGFTRYDKIVRDSQLLHSMSYICPHIVISPLDNRHYALATQYIFLIDGESLGLCHLGSKDRLEPSIIFIGQRVASIVLYVTATYKMRV